MEIEKITKAVHGKAAICTYKFIGGRLMVYLRNNIPCKPDWGSFYLSVFVHPTSSANDIDAEMFEFDSYADFRKFRTSFMEKQNFEAVIKDLKYDFILNQLDPLKNQGMCIELLIGAKGWSELDMRTHGFVINDSIAYRIWFGGLDALSRYKRNLNDEPVNH